MQIKLITASDELWEPTAVYAEQCSWKAGPFLAREMRANNFTDWERVFVAIEDNKPAGYCTLAKADCIPDVTYTPYIGFMFVGEEFRGI
ncbi:MAG TPA: GNAT family N-acetyltransferase [Mobilitalea sp.]|nr:GNAT family N-acetyltransferase [Mobilitalea sp.]